MKNQDDSGRPNRVVDLEKALERLGGDRVLLRQMAEMYLEDIPQLLKELKDSVARKDAPDATRAAHSIAGLSSTFEAQSCQEIAKAIENCGQKNDLGEAASQIPALQDEFERVCEALKKGID